MRIISIVTSTLAIVPMYLLSRKFFNEKYSLVAVCLLAFEPHINFRAGFGYTEALYVPLIILSVYFILNQKDKLVYLSFFIAGLVWWTRLEGFIIFFVISVIYFVYHNKTKKNILKYLLCIVIFAIVVSPILIQRNDQFGDPFYFYYNDHLFVENYIGVGLQESGKTASSYVEDQGALKFVERFILSGMILVFEQLIRLSFPYLFFLIPFGLLFSFRAFDQQKINIKSNWLVILIYAGFIIIPFSVIPDRRFLFALMPFLIIFATLTVQRVVEYGLSTFSLSQSQKNWFLVIFLSFLIILAGIFMLRYEKDSSLEHEKIEFTQYLATKIDGTILDNGKDRAFTHGYFFYAKLNDPPEHFKNYNILDLLRNY